MHLCPLCEKRLNLQVKEGSTQASEACGLCGGILQRAGQFYEIFKEETGRYQFETFLIGLRVPEDLIERDREFIRANHPKSRTFKEEFQYLLGTRIERELLLKANFSSPEVVFTVDQSSLDYNVWIKPLYISGKYLKLRRGIPQSPWIKGGKGREETKSVSEYIGESAMDISGGRDYNFFASGREDVEALMLGTGRPFYVEIKQPRFRSIEMPELRKIILEKSGQGVDALEMRVSGKREIDDLKRKRFNKAYEVGIIIEGNAGNRLEEAVKKLRNIVIRQKTPNRVLPIRADMERERRIWSVDVKEINGPRATLLIKAEAGTYIKEFITGDQGRTMPNLSEELEVNVKIDYLNVTEIY